MSKLYNFQRDYRCSSLELYEYENNVSPINKKTFFMQKTQFRSFDYGFRYWFLGTLLNKN